MVADGGQIRSRLYFEGCRRVLDSPVDLGFDRNLPEPGSVEYDVGCAVHAAIAFKDDGVRFVGVIYQDDPEQAAAFLDELGWGDNYDYVVDPGSRAAIAFGVFGVPETFFIDRDGIIVGKISGESDALLLGSTIDQILQGGQPGDYNAGTIQSQPDG